MRTCARTLEFLKAQAIGVAVVSCDWITDSIEDSQSSALSSPRAFGIWGDLDLYTVAYIVQSSRNRRRRKTKKQTTGLVRRYEWLKATDWWGTDFGPCESARRHRRTKAPARLQGYSIAVVADGVPAEAAYHQKKQQQQQQDEGSAERIRNRPIHRLEADEVELLCRLWGARVVDTDAETGATNEKYTSAQAPTNGLIVLVPDEMEQDKIDTLMMMKKNQVGDRNTTILRWSWLVDSIAANYVAPMANYRVISTTTDSGRERMD